ncbi:MAG: phosphotransferase family protein [Saprospiraceae bacterium]|nr:phosphotransferase family protein [Saprospiraceae bacterium]
MLSETGIPTGLNETLFKQLLLKKGLAESINSDTNWNIFTNGYSNLTYLLLIEDKSYVVRRAPKGAVKRGHDMKREYTVLSRLHPVFPEAPQTFLYADDKDVWDSHFYIMEQKHGVVLTLKEARERQVLSESFKVISDAWLRKLVELHGLDYKSAGLDEIGRPDGYVERQVTNWVKQYHAAATEDIQEAELVANWMRENQPSTYDHSLIHNDFKYDNLMFDEKDWSKINAVLDWEMCTIGDPLMDLGTSLAYWSMPEDGPMITQGLPSPTLMKGNPGRAEVVESYARMSGRPVDDICFYYVYGLFKLAVIAQQIYYRYHKGLTDNKKFANLNQACRFLCMMAWQAAQKKRIEKLF